jgi:SPOR domain
MTPAGSEGDPDGGARHCTNCGQPLVASAAFCRSCGARYEAPRSTPTETAPRTAGPASSGSPGRRRTAIWVAAAIILIGAGAAVAILLSSGGGSPSTTVLVSSEGTTATETTTIETSAGTTTEVADAPSASSVEAGRYVQAGSFKTVSHAETERERLAAAGVDVRVVSSDGAEELYPGFQVLLGGPFEAGSEEAATIKALRHNGVPSAFARNLTPAAEISGPAETAGRWSGLLDRSSGEHPNLTGPLSVSLEMDAGGRTGTLEFEAGCRDELTLSERTATTLSYAQGQFCAGSGDLLVRPADGQLMLSLLPLDSDVLVLGSLSPG